MLSAAVWADFHYSSFVHIFINSFSIGLMLWAERYKFPAQQQALPLVAMQMNNSLKLIDDRTLCLCDNDDNVLAKHKPCWTKFVEFKRVKENCNIIKESDENFPQVSNDVANIYCLDDDFNVRWTIKAPFSKDTFPNRIVWDTQTVRKQNVKGYLTLDINKNPDTFICSSWRGFTVTVEYETGITKSIEFTK